VSKCHRTRHLMGPYLYGDLRGKELRFVEGHLAICSECRAEFAAVESALALVPPDALNPSDETRARILAAAERLTARPHRFAPRWLPKWGLAAAALVLGVLIGYQLPRSPSLPTDTAAPAVVRADSASDTVPVQKAAGSHGGQSPEEGVPSSVNGGGGANEIVDSHAQATAPQTSPPEQRSGPDLRPTRSLVASVPALRAPRPLGIDDVQVAEAVHIEDIR
jgi:anti-sigma factor RsiW